CRDVRMELPEQIDRDLIPVRDKRTKIVRRKYHAHHIALGRRPATKPTEDALRARIRHEHIPPATQDDRGIRLLLMQNELDRASRPRHLRRLEISLLIPGRIASGDQ